MILLEPSYRGRRASLGERRMRFGKVITVGLGLVLMGPAMAAAERALRGRVFDDSGGALPGVTVEASGPALAERSRVTVTDGTGQYAITDLRPGTYMLTFALPGFGTQVREELGLSADVVLHVDVAMSLRAIEAPMTVWGPSPVVDVQQLQRGPRLCQVDVERTRSATSEVTTPLSPKHDRAARRGVGCPARPEDGTQGDDPVCGGAVDTAARDPR